MSEGKTGNYGSEVPPEMAPFDAWSEWMRANMGPMTATPGASEVDNLDHARVERLLQGLGGTG